MNNNDKKAKKYSNISAVVDEKRKRKLLCPDSF